VIEKIQNHLNFQILKLSFFFFGEILLIKIDIPKKFVAPPLLEECEDDTHTLEMGTWESFGTQETSEFQGSKHLALRHSSCHWKAIEV